jgi:hypothetical protein
MVYVSRRHQQQNMATDTLSQRIGTDLHTARRCELNQLHAEGTETALPIKDALVPSFYPFVVWQTLSFPDHGWPVL